MAKKNKKFSSAGIRGAVQEVHNRPAFKELKKRLLEDSKKTTKTVTLKYWGGFCDNCLMHDEIDDGFGGSNIRLSPMLFDTKKEAKLQFQDVRKVIVSWEEYI